MATTFTIFFDGHLWVGVLEQRDGGQIRAARVVFGREPSGAEIEDWLRRHGNNLIARASAAQPIDDGGRPTVRARSPKRAQREAAERGTGGTQHDESHQERDQESSQDNADRAFQEGLNGTAAPPPPSGTGAQEPEAPTAVSTPLRLPGALTRILPPSAVSAALRGWAGAARSSCGLGRTGSCGASLGPRTSAGGMVGHRRHRVTSRADARPEAARSSRGECPIRSRREAMRPTAPPSAG